MIRQNKKIARLGKKGNEWEAIKKLLKPAFMEAGITRCELGPVLYSLGFEKEAEKHRHWFFLNWVHGKKRRESTKVELMSLVALGCVDCHEFIEYMPHEEMEKVVRLAISRRKQQPKTMQMEVDSI